MIKDDAPVLVLWSVDKLRGPAHTLASLGIAWETKTRRFPTVRPQGRRYRTGNCLSQGLPGLVSGFLGMLLGFTLLILPYLWGGMGAGDVKALAALGAWLGPKLIAFLFCYMGIAGGIIALGYLAWKGRLWEKIKEGWSFLVNLILCQPPAPPARRPMTEGSLWGRHCRGDDDPGGKLDPGSVPASIPPDFDRRITSFAVGLRCLAASGK
jgi:hypothetical protein